ncbi:EEV membrane phosphoglycoprotein [Yokapox virus]|uniref:Protein OPG161 n=1 Tax=Yokapox virus TaxID=1076255 RepID=G3EI31_9POXV|nr:EEV membrane phosphoglycoprotein [Yokapox virus]AEN03728.1 EEV membrane phosphoglycoprotein [Yokapox virus]
MMNPENVDVDEETSIFSATVYGGKNNKYKKNTLSLYIRLSMIVSLISMISISVFLTIKLNKCISIEDDVYTKPSTNRVVSARQLSSSHNMDIFKKCDGLVYQSYCYILNIEPKSFDDSKTSCEDTNSTLPNKTDVLNNWLINYTDDTWGQDGNPINKEENDVYEADVTTEVRKYFCVKKIY